jgi:hypothetical protein
MKPVPIKVPEPKQALLSPTAAVRGSEPQSYKIHLQLGTESLFQEFRFSPATLLRDTFNELQKKWPDLNGLDIEFALMDTKDNCRVISSQTAIADINDSHDSLVIRPASRLSLDDNPEPTDLSQTCL